MRLPQAAIDAALLAAAQSPCAKSKRGVCLFDAIDADPHSLIEAVGFNHPPHGVVCDGSPACRASCGRSCIHAEMAALRCIARTREPEALDLVHVELGAAGGVEPCAGPSCWQCSREILDVGIGGVWLYELNSTSVGGIETGVARWVRRSAWEFHCVTCANAKGGAVYVGGSR